MALERQLSTTDMAITFRNIWEDPEAAAFVRASADGNEIVPTIEVGETVMVNPSADEVVVAVTAQAYQWGWRCLGAVLRIFEKVFKKT